MLIFCAGKTLLNESIVVLKMSNIFKKDFMSVHSSIGPFDRLRVFQRTTFQKEILVLIASGGKTSSYCWVCIPLQNSDSVFIFAQCSCFGLLLRKCWCIANILNLIKSFIKNITFPVVEDLYTATHNSPWHRGESS